MSELSMVDDVLLSDWSRLCMGCLRGNKSLVESIYMRNSEIDLSREDEKAYRWACRNGHLEVVRWLLSVKPDINLMAQNDYAWLMVCRNGHLELAKWLMSTSPRDITEYHWLLANENGHVEMSDWLLEMEPSLRCDDNAVVSEWCDLPTKSVNSSKVCKSSNSSM